MQRPSSSSATCAAAATNAKSERARADLEKAGADALVRPDRKPDRADAFARPDRRQHRPDEEIIGRHRSSAVARSRSTISAPSVTATSGISADGSALAIDPPTVPRLRVGGCPTHGSTRASSGTDARITRIALGLRLPRRRADHDRAVFLANSRKLRQAQDVDQPGRARQPHRQHRHQRLSAGDHARILVGGQQCAGFGERCRPDIIERGGFHELAGPQAGQRLMAATSRRGRRSTASARPSVFSQAPISWINARSLSARLVNSPPAGTIEAPDRNCQTQLKRSS